MLPASLLHRFKLFLCKPRILDLTFVLFLTFTGPGHFLTQFLSNVEFAESFVISVVYSTHTCTHTLTLTQPTFPFILGRTVRTKTTKQQKRVLALFLHVYQNG